MNIQIVVNATWGEYEDLIELRGDSRNPQLAFDSGKLEIEGEPNDWPPSVRGCIDQLIEDQEDLLEAILAEALPENRQRISWEEVKRELKVGV